MPEAVVGEMLDSGMLAEVLEDGARGPSLKVTRIGRIAVRQMLAPSTVVTLARSLLTENAVSLTFLDILLLHCLLEDSPPDTPHELLAIARNKLRGAQEGRKPGLDKRMRDLRGLILIRSGNEYYDVFHKSFREISFILYIACGFGNAETTPKRKGQPLRLPNMLPTLYLAAER